jgi:hypothetical protein
VTSAPTWPPIGRLIHARCPHTLGWLQRHERATTVLAASPLAVHQ